MELIKKLPEYGIFKKRKKQHVTIIGFSMFFGWLLAVPFEGQVLYQLLQHAEIEATTYTMVAVMAHFFGLFMCGFLIKRQLAAKLTMVTSTVVCIAGSLIFFLPFTLLWNIALISISFFSGLFVACWGYFFKIYSRPGERLIIAADVLILSNGIMIFINVLAAHVSAFVALTVAIMALFWALLQALRLEAGINKSFLEAKHNSSELKNTPNSLRPILILGAFILIITINSGLMYQVVVPAFSHLALLTSYYWAVPYILVLLVIRRLSSKTNIAYVLYIALTMIGMSYIVFMLVDTSITSYLIINTLMLGAFGVFDIFWWSILGKFLEYYDNPIKVWGIGLSMNVLGILIGGYIGSVIVADGDYLIASIVALTVVLVVLLVLPILNNQLTRIFRNHVFLFQFVTNDGVYTNQEHTNKEQMYGEQKYNDEKALLEFKENNKLTDREAEIMGLLMRGYTYKAIAKSLYISENTMKYHTKNIYQKLNIKSKMELIQLFTKSKNEHINVNGHMNENTNENRMNI